MQFIYTLQVIAPQYDALLLDLWGCVHDGSALYPGVRECLSELKQAGKKIIFVSNAPRRIHKVISVLDQLGIDRAWYDGVVSSGEVGFKRLQQEKPRAYYFIGPDRDADVIDGLAYTRVSDVSQADFLLNSGFGSEEESMENWSDLLAAASQNNLPMLCLNPDMEVVKITGERFPCAGLIAQEYEKLGGKVEYVGKPYAEIYAQALALAGNPVRENVLAIGDSLHTDIAGANLAGIDSALITGGILKQELGDSPESMARYLAAQKVQPTYVLSGLAW